MTFKNILAVTAALSLGVAPVVAQAASVSVPARGSSEVTDSENLRGGFIVPLIAIVAIILGILAMTGGDGDPPTSP